MVSNDPWQNAGDGGSNQTVLIKIALYGLLMDKTRLRGCEGYGPPTPALKYIHVWKFDMYTVLGYLTFSSSADFE